MVVVLDPPKCDYLSDTDNFDKVAFVYILFPIINIFEQVKIMKNL